MNQDGAVPRYCEALWALREERGLTPGVAEVQSRELALATAEHVRTEPGYCPDEDKRVLWARSVIHGGLRGEERPRAGLELEVAMDFLRGDVEEFLCGKALAAGEQDAGGGMQDGRGKREDAGLETSAPSGKTGQDGRGKTGQDGPATAWGKMPQPREGGGR